MAWICSEVSQICYDTVLIYFNDFKPPFASWDWNERKFYFNSFQAKSLFHTKKGKKQKLYQCPFMHLCMFSGNIFLYGFIGKWSIASHVFFSCITTLMPGMGTSNIKIYFDPLLNFFIWTWSKLLDVMLTFYIPCKLVSLVSEGLLQLITYVIKP